ncbi:MAG: PQQ-binding-like beta-propeller repeat protein, partial [Planctomycetia bacterium]|nr:PQQ-binding-like beta-propeller repeat protein [Planctomycetia bacterium]
LQWADEVARAPHMTQFIANPAYCPRPVVSVASHGRIFRAFGGGESWPGLSSMLLCMNGYNGAVLWKWKLNPKFMIHRNTLIATPDTIYVADDTSCKLLDAATGKLKGEIKAPADISDGPVWKWMGIEDGVLYALVGEVETTDWKAGNIKNYIRGFGRTILAIDVKTKKVLWHYRSAELLDSRAMCMKAGRIFFYSHKKFVGCLDAKTGKELWKTSDEKILEAIGEHYYFLHFQYAWCPHFPYTLCNDKVLFFVGPQRKRTVAISAKDGKLLWQYPEGNYHCVLREDGLYAFDTQHPSKQFDIMTGKVLRDLPRRFHCTRVTGSIDRIWSRDHGTSAWDLAAEKWVNISPMRPGCDDGVTVANGHLYWSPWTCGCPLSLVGIIALGPGGDFNYSAKATEAERLETQADNPAKVAALKMTPDDWPAYRKDNARTALTRRTIPEKVSQLWRFESRKGNTPTAPVTAGGMVFVAGSDGTVRALDAKSGKQRWSAYTGGMMKYPPAIADGRALVGSGDGWIYAYEATSGKLLWRFRAAPVEPKIPVYDKLMSTWPVASGVLVEKGTAYAAAGIANYDGTHVYALDAATGKIRWQNNTSGGTDGGAGAGASVMGHLLFHKGTLYMAGGNCASVAQYDADTGKYSTTGMPHIVKHLGKDLFIKEGGEKVISSGLYPLYTSNHHIEKADLMTPAGTLRISLSAPIANWRPAGDPAPKGEQKAGNSLRMFKSGEAHTPKAAPLWRSRPFQHNSAVAIAGDVVLVAGSGKTVVEKSEKPAANVHGLVALSLAEGKELWRHPLPAAPVVWGLAVDRDGRILVSLRDGSIACFGKKK